jgi:hypothetical protein
MKADFPYANFDGVPEEIRRQLFIFPRANHANSFTPPATVWLLKRSGGNSNELSISPSRKAKVLEARLQRRARDT